MMVDVLGLYSHAHNCEDSFLSKIPESENIIVERFSTWIKWGEGFGQDEAYSLLSNVGIDPSLGILHAFVSFVSEITRKLNVIVKEIQHNGYGIECECQCSPDPQGNPKRAYVKQIPRITDDDIHFCPIILNNPNLLITELGQTLAHELSHYSLRTKDVESWDHVDLANPCESLNTADFYEDLFKVGISFVQIERFWFNEIKESSRPH